MTEYDTADQESTAVRPTYVPLGVDAEGRHHVYRTTNETVHVVGRDCGREHVEPIGRRPVDEWMTFVAERRGWDRRDYGQGLGAAVARALGGEA
jgi:hypothetical protein